MMPQHGDRLAVALRLHQAGQLPEAEDLYRQVLAQQPRNAAAHNYLGILATQTERFEWAAELLGQAIAIEPGNKSYHNNLGNALRRLGRVEEAIGAYGRALALVPGDALTLCNVGLARQEQGDMEAARGAFHEALRTAPDLAEAHSGLGTVLVAEGRLAEGIVAFREAILRRPAYADAHVSLGMALLMRGDFAEGWREMEWRWQCPGFTAPQRDFRQPQWDGGDLAGQRILLHAEQGIGDTLQFMRYAGLVAARGGRVVVECQCEVAGLLRRVAGVQHVVEQGQGLPEFDLHCPLLSLPLACQTRLETIPATVPYVEPDPLGVRAWAGRVGELGAGLRVGLVWAGSPRFRQEHIRSPRQLSLLAPLAGVPGVRFVSLQKGEAGQQARVPPEGMALADWTEALRDFADTAALLANLDLVISSDTSVAHLAGAMGKPVWVMLPLAPDWRWMLGCEDSPWYPTMRLFRQRRWGDWAGVVEQVKAALQRARVGGFGASVAEHQ